MVCVDVLLTCHLFHIWASLVGSMMKYFLNPCNTLEGMLVHFADIVYFLCRDKHHHYFSYLHMELITNPVFMFNIFTSSVNHSDAISESTTFNPFESIGICMSNRCFCYVSSYSYIPEYCTQPSLVPFVTRINFVPQQMH
jgi:hypothetical protein